MSPATRKTKTTNAVHSTYVRQMRTSVKPTIVIAEDHDDTREMLGLLYKMWGCRVIEACNGLEAVNAATREQPALILMDGSLPYLDGLAATRRIRKNKHLRGVKIIALNGWGSPSYTAAALAAGCDDCLVKPLDFEWLRNNLKDVRQSLRVMPQGHHEFNQVPRSY